jgi:hypothetical protein
MDQQIGRAYYGLPWYYDKGEEVRVLFRTDREVLKSLLPSVLDLPEGPGLAMVTAVHHTRSTFGPYIGVYLGVLATYKGDTVLHRLSGMKNSFSGVAAGRELWGMPLEYGEPTMAWEGDVLNIVARRQGKDFARLAVRLERRTDQPVSKIKTSTSIARRPPWEQAEKENVLLGSSPSSAKPEDMVFWSGSATLKLLGGDPGDDWSILPVHEVLETTFTADGFSHLPGPYILEEY